MNTHAMMPFYGSWASYIKASILQLGQWLYEAWRLRKAWNSCLFHWRRQSQVSEVTHSRALQWTPRS